ncbi:Zuotin [Diplonema papillatum]|nr:Zuotin [Diplonema papillatum]|eukprot:gene8576-13256_t
MAGGVVEWAWAVPAAEDEVVVVRSASAATKLTAECVGWSFERALCRWCPKKAVKKDEPTSPATVQPKKVAEKLKKKITSTKLSDVELEGDHYELLGIEDKSWEATDDEVAKAYKKKCLETHPDKLGGDETLFKKVQVAGDVLMSPIKRKAYDSSLPFDDTIPGVKVAEADFYNLFGPVFERNKMWSVGGRKKVPCLGNDSTPMEEVDAFYKFWLSFRSWRDFSHEAAEHDLEQADHRDERRWMERENQRAVEKMKKEETSRVNQLVERAYKNDPRIRRRDAGREAEKQKIRDAKRMEEVNRIREEKEAAERKVKEEAEDKILRKERQQKEKKVRQSIRKVIRPMEGYDDGQIKKTVSDWLLAKLELSDLQALLIKFEEATKENLLVDAFYESVLDAEEKFQETRKGISTVRREDNLAKRATTEQKNAAWTNEELLELQKACTRYPAGTVDRWEKLSEFMMAKKTPRECLTRVKLLEQEYRMPQQGHDSLKKAVKTLLPEATTTGAEGKTDSSNPRKYAEQNGTSHAPAAKPTTNGTSHAAPAAAAAAAAAPHAATNGHSKPADAKPAAATAAAAAAPAANSTSDALPAAEPAAEVAAEAEEELWSPAQQKALETVLRDMKAYKEKDKWDKIAGAVEGKTRKQCVTRYKFLCAQLKK